MYNTVTDIIIITTRGMATTVILGFAAGFLTTDLPRGVKHTHIYIYIYREREREIHIYIYIYIYVYVHTPQDYLLFLLGLVSSFFLAECLKSPRRAGPGRGRLLVLLVDSFTSTTSITSITSIIIIIIISSSSSSLIIIT